MHCRAHVQVRLAEVVDILLLPAVQRPQVARVVLVALLARRLRTRHAMISGSLGPTSVRCFLHWLFQSTASPSSFS